MTNLPRLFCAASWIAAGRSIKFRLLLWVCRVYSCAAWRRGTRNVAPSGPPLRPRHCSDHVEEIEQDDDGDRNPENPKQDAAHDKPRSLKATEHSWTAINGGSMAERITDRWLQTHAH